MRQRHCTAVTAAAIIVSASEWPGQPKKLPIVDLHPNLIHGSLGPPESLSKWHVDRFSHFCTAHRRVFHYFTMGQYVFLKKLPLSLGGSGPPSNTWYLGPTGVIKPNGISIGLAIFVWVPNAMLYDELSVGKKTPKLPFPIGTASPCRRWTEPQR